MRKPRSSAMSAAQLARRRLVEAPIIIVHHGSSRSWAGCHIPETVPTNGHRVGIGTREDESFYLALVQEKD